MRALLLSRSLSRALATRAVIVWAMVRLLVSAVFALVPPEITASGATIRATPSHAVIIALAVIVGMVDLRRRGEWMLWANLGISVMQLALLFAGTALAGELLLSLLLER